MWMMRILWRGIATDNCRSLADSMDEPSALFLGSSRCEASVGKYEHVHPLVREPIASAEAAQDPAAFCMTCNYRSANSHTQFLRLASQCQHRAYREQL